MAIAHRVVAACAASARTLKSAFTVLPQAGVRAYGNATKNAAKLAVAFVSALGTFINEAFNIISRRVLTDPIDYFMEGLPQYREKHRTYEPSRGQAKEETAMSAGAKGRLKGPPPSFTSKTGKRGYD